MSHGMQILNSNGDAVFDSDDTHLVVHAMGLASMNFDGSGRPTGVTVSFPPTSSKPYVHISQRPLWYSYFDAGGEVLEIDLYYYGSIITSDGQYVGFSIDTPAYTGTFIGRFPDPPWLIPYVVFAEA